MKRKFVVVAVGLVLVSCAIAQVVQRIKHPYARQLEITLQLEHDDYLVMEPLFCKVTIKNVGTTPIPNFNSYYGAGEPYIFVVKNKKGQQMPDTAYNKAVLLEAEKAKTGVFIGGSPDSPDLAPGQSSFGRFAINQFIDLTEAGSTVDWREGGSGDNYHFTAYVERFGARSNTATFTCSGGLYDVNNPNLQMFFERRKIKEGKR